jgi:hypothetical protein
MKIIEKKPLAVGDRVWLLSRESGRSGLAWGKAVRVVRLAKNGRVQVMRLVDSNRPEWVERSELV